MDDNGVVRTSGLTDISAGKGEKNSSEIIFNNVNNAY